MAPAWGNSPAPKTMEWLEMICSSNVVPVRGMATIKIGLVEELPGQLILARFCLENRVFRRPNSDPVSVSSKIAPILA